MPFVVFEPAHVRVEAAAGESIFDVARRIGTPISTACYGRATCGLCRVKILAGDAALTAFSADEKKHLGNVYFITKERLSCQARVAAADDSEIVVQVPPLRVREA